MWVVIYVTNYILINTPSATARQPLKFLLISQDEFHTNYNATEAQAEVIATMCTPYHVEGKCKKYHNLNLHKHSFDTYLLREDRCQMNACVNSNCGNTYMPTVNELLHRRQQVRAATLQIVTSETTKPEKATNRNSHRPKWPQTETGAGWWHRKQHSSIYMGLSKGNPLCKKESFHKKAVMRKAFPCHDVVMWVTWLS